MKSKLVTSTLILGLIACEAWSSREREVKSPLVERAVPQVGTVFGRLEALHEELTDTEQRITKAVNERVDVTAQALTARLNILQAATLILPCIEWLSTNNPIPYEWRETIAEIMQRDIAKQEGVVGLLRARECWTRVDKSDTTTPLKVENTHTMMRGITDTGKLITVWAWTTLSGGMMAAYIEFSETSSDSFFAGGNPSYATEDQLEFTRNYILQKMREGCTITELILATSALPGWLTTQSVPTRIQNLKHPPSNVPELEWSTTVGFTSCLDYSIEKILARDFFSNNSTTLIQYHNPDATDFWYDVPATAIHYGS
ncbi:MAG: hypothetical protein LBJ69_02530 [Holosporales bacterium]|jgi:hypothetical protein|nr:hypothetical protein [Holosporales bacterium]